MSVKNREDIIAAVRAAQQKANEEDLPVVPIYEPSVQEREALSEDKPAPAPKAVTPKPAPEPKAVQPKPAPAPKAVQPKPAPAPKVVQPKPAPAPKAAPPKPAPEPKAVQPKPAPAPKAVQPKPAPAPKAAPPKPAPAPKVPVKNAEESAPEPDYTEKMIEVKNVSMIFKVSSGNANGLKDYLIQKFKGKMKSRELKALDNISFDVYKGEVVGIIGTNGSGKSTLLKIVSGVLNPTEGQVKVDRNKVQLLTLGTGFDFELTARENVYLNGALIGYTKEFIDDHYDYIVDFAELKDFMDEKVKNFSSGMVSRLAFAIATAGNAAEILILDEVLSVGDAFFRKKSMQRVKEMIHGGSTVLIVSHSVGTIKEHCNKVIWIEKGVQKMVGSPKEVCDAYAKLQKK